MCIHPLEVPHAAEKGEGSVSFPLQETVTSLAIVYFALESSPLVCVELSFSERPFPGLFTRDVCLYLFILLCGSLPLQVIMSGDLKPSQR